MMTDIDAADLHHRLINLILEGNMTSKSIEEACGIKYTVLKRFFDYKGEKTRERVLLKLRAYILSMEEEQ